jgi:hypothetical protein
MNQLAGLFQPEKSLASKGFNFDPHKVIASKGFSAAMPTFANYSKPLEGKI